MDVLLRIKRLVIQGQVRFTVKAKEDMKVCDLESIEVMEAIINATSIAKVLRSRSPNRSHATEKLYVIKGLSYQGTAIYTKSKIDQEEGREVFYILISAKLDRASD